jgi:hypothetical protein
MLAHLRQMLWTAARIEKMFFLIGRITDRDTRAAAVLTPLEPRTARAGIAL